MPVLFTFAVKFPDNRIFLYIEKQALIIITFFLIVVNYNSFTKWQRLFAGRQPPRPRADWRLEKSLGL